MKYLIVILISCLFYFNVNAQKIATFHIFHIIENLAVYKNFAKELDQFKKKRFDQLKKEEELLIIKQKEIEESKLILNEMEYLNKISNLTDEKKSFEKKVIKLNNYIKKNIEMNEEIVLNEIISIVKKIAEEDNIDIVFSENQYFLASDNVDISSKIFNILNDLNIRLQLSEYE